MDDGSKETEITTYLFDLDGTLVDEKIYSQIYSKIVKMIKEKKGLNEEEIDAKGEQWKLTKNKEGRWDTGELCKELGLLNSYYRILEKEIQAKRKSIMHKKIIAVLRDGEKKKKKIGIVSNSFRKTISLYIKALHLDKQIDFVFSSEDAGCKKKEKKFWKKLIEREGLTPEKCLVIGNDEIEDQNIPRLAGFRTRLMNS